MAGSGNRAFPVLRAVSQSVLSSIRLSATSLSSGAQPPISATSSLPSLLSHFRFFAKAASSYLDRGEVTDRVVNVVKNFPKVDPAKVTPTSTFKDLGLDSLDAVEIVMAFEEEFAVEVPDADADKILTTEDAIEYFASHPQAK